MTKQLTSLNHVAQLWQQGYKLMLTRRQYGLAAYNIFVRLREHETIPQLFRAYHENNDWCIDIATLLFPTTLSTEDLAATEDAAYWLRYSETDKCLLYKGYISVICLTYS